MNGDESTYMLIRPMPVMGPKLTYKLVRSKTAVGHYVKVPIMRSSMLLGRSMACMSAINLLVHFT